jgi:hypothetical protein
VAQELPNQFVRPGIRVENDLRCYVPELVACQLEADMSEYAPLDCYRDSPKSSRPALAGYEQSIWAPADHRRCDLITKRVEAVGKPGRELKLERALILRLVRAFRKETTVWPPSTLQKLKAKLRVPAEVLDDWIDLIFVSKRTKCITRMIYLPFVIIALMVLSRSPLLAYFAPSVPDPGFNGPGYCGRARREGC